MSLPLALALAAAASSGAAGQPASSAESPALVAHADGSWEVARAIEEEPWAVELATDGLITDDELAEDRDAIRAAGLDEQAEDAFEDAVDGARAEARLEPQP